jgi:penicillin-binding protein 1A
MHKTNEKREQPHHIRRRRLLRALVVVVGLGSVGLIATTAGVIGAFYYVQPILPAAQTIRHIPLQVPLRIYSRDGYLISEIGERRRIPITFEDVPPHVVNAFVAAEDQRFFVHPGIDYRGVMRAALRLIRTGGASGGGGSTITQQLARDYFLSLEQTAARKLTEAFLAYKIEQEFSKQQIMALFLNKMFFGQRAHGVAAAAKVFFNKNLSELNVAEAATLAGVLPAPSVYNPVTSATNATHRRRYVLGRMLALGYIDEFSYDESIAFPMESKSYVAQVELNAPYVAEMARSEMIRRYGDSAYTGGYQVVTTLDAKQQRAANYALRNGLLEFTRRRGYRGAVSKVDLSAAMLATPFDAWPTPIQDTLRRYAPGGLSIALVSAVGENNSAAIIFGDGSRADLPWAGIRWANPFIDRETFGPAPETAAEVLAVGDIVYVMPTAAGHWALAQIPEAQGAVVAIDPYDGAISALTGGFDFTISKFNRARQAYRQPGSSFKPFIYSAALAHGSTAATIILDAPVVISSSELESVWRPINYSGRFYGPTRLREALVRSMNLVSVRLLLFHAGVGNTVRHIEKFGFGDAALPRNGSLALGGGSASPLDMAQGYAVLANGGHAIKPFVIDTIFGPDNELLYRADPAVVCDECVTDDLGDNSKDDATDDDNRMSLEEMSSVVMSYRPDANTAPWLFADVNVAPQVIDRRNVYIVQDMMRDVVRRGTGARAWRELGRKDLSGKTGTSNDRRDAWFGGFNAKLAAIVWVGYDDDQPLGPREEGSRTALPIWIEFMRIALRGVPESRMAMPEGIVNVKIDRETGCPAVAGQANTMFEIFRVEHVPDCEQLAEIDDPFNNAIGTDPEPEVAADEDELMF